MKVHLMHRDTDLIVRSDPQWNEPALVADLALDTLFDAMAAGDPVVREVVAAVLPEPLTDADAVAYRQAVLADALAHEAMMRGLYQVAVDALNAQRQVWGLAHSPDSTLSHGLQVLELLVGMFTRLRELARDYGGQVRSSALTRFFPMVATELDDDYLRQVRTHLQRLRFHDGTLISAQLTRGNTATGHVLRASERARWPWQRPTPAYSLEIAPRDENGLRSLADIRAQGIIPVAEAVTQSSQHVLDFFTALRTETAFYVGCLNLADRLRAKGEPFCLPQVAPGAGILTARGLYDPGLSLTLGDARAVGNDIDADHGPLLVVTGANTGGKSTVLRAVGVAHLMAGAGMMVPASAATIGLRGGVFTHFKREEDASMTSGKFDEELSRMSAIVDHLVPGSLVLLNESFSATNEREGSLLAQGVIDALLDSGMRVVLVTHQFELARHLQTSRGRPALFLRADPRPDGGRSFILHPGDPRPTSHGEDLYAQIFPDDQGIDAQAAGRAV